MAAMMRTSTIWVMRLPTRWISPDLEGAEQFHLGVERQLADLVQEQGRAVGILEAADMAVEGAGERALFVAEQHRFDEIFGDRAAIDGVELLLAARRGGVDRLGDDLLARAALALDQHRDAGAGGLGGDRKGGAELRGGADDLLEAQRLGDLLGQRAQLARGLAAVGGGVEGGEQPVGRQRLDDEVGGAGAHRIDRDGDVVLGGEDEQGKLGAKRADLADELAALLARQPVIEQYGVELGLLRVLEHLPGGVEIAGAAHPPAGARADGGHQPALRRLVVDQQQATIGVRPHLFPRLRGPTA